MKWYEKEKKQGKTMRLESKDTKRREKERGKNGEQTQNQI